MFKSGSFKGNPLYFGRKQGGLLDVIEKINKLNPKPEVKLITDDKEAYQKFFQAALKKFGAKSPAEMDDEKKKKFFDYIDKNYKSDAEKNEGELPPALKKAIEKKKKAKGEAHDDEEEEGKKYGNVTVHGEQGEIAKPFSGPQRMKEVLAKMWKSSLKKEEVEIDEVNTAQIARATVDGDYSAKEDELKSKDPKTRVKLKNRREMSVYDTKKGGSYVEIVHPSGSTVGVLFNKKFSPADLKKYFDAY